MSVRIWRTTLAQSWMQAVPVAPRIRSVRLAGSWPVPFSFGLTCPLPRRTRAEAEAAIAQGEAQLARYLDLLDSRRAAGRDTTSAEVLVRAAASQINMAVGGELGWP